VIKQDNDTSAGEQGLDGKSVSMYGGNQGSTTRDNKGQGAASHLGTEGASPCSSPDDAASDTLRTSFCKADAAQAASEGAAS
jgi:hypothetical protein